MFRPKGSLRRARGPIELYSFRYRSKQRLQRPSQRGFHATDNRLPPYRTHRRAWGLRCHSPSLHLGPRRARRDRHDHRRDDVGRRHRHRVLAHRRNGPDAILHTHHHNAAQDDVDQPFPRDGENERRPRGCTRRPRLITREGNVVRHAGPGRRNGERDVLRPHFRLAQRHGKRCGGRERHRAGSGARRLGNGAKRCCSIQRRQQCRPGGITRHLGDSSRRSSGFQRGHWHRPGGVTRYLGNGAWDNGAWRRGSVRRRQGSFRGSLGGPFRGSRPRVTVNADRRYPLHP